MRDASLPRSVDPHALVGTWVGGGEGQYPTIDPFTYVETVIIATVPDKPFLSYAQRTSHPDTAAPMHAEVGYLRFPPSAAEPLRGADTATPTRPAEMTIAQPTGVTECHSGTLALEDDEIVLDLESTSVGRTPSAKEVTSVRRRIVVRGDVLAYDLWMAAVGQPDTLHLRAVLHRQTAS